MTTEAITRSNGSRPQSGPDQIGRPPRPEVRLLTVHVRRVIRTAPYESWEIDEEMQAAPDANQTSRQNLAAMRRLLTAEIDAACAELRSPNDIKEA